MAVKNDIKAGTSITIPRRNRLGMRATRTAEVTGLTENNLANKAAIDEAIAAAGEQHHAITELPLSSCSVSSGDAAGKRMVRLGYGWSESDIPPVPANDLVRSRGGYVQLSWLWLHHGGFSGWIASAIVGAIIPANSYTWKPRTFQILRMVLPTVLLADPTPTVHSQLGLLNEDSFQIGALVAAPQTLRFDAVNVRPALQYPSGRRFIVEYAFSYRPTRWLHQVRYDYPGSWYAVTTELISDTTPFSGVFPVHA